MKKNNPLSSLLKRIGSNWSFLRVLRLVLSLLILGESYYSGEWIFAGIGGILLLQALLNTGCCAAGGCYTDTLDTTPSQRSSVNETVTFTEIK